MKVQNGEQKETNAKSKCKRLVLLTLIDLLIEEGELKKKRNRVCWVRPWIARRQERGAFHQLARELVVEDAAGYRDFFKLNSQQFQFLIDKISHLISKEDTFLRPSIKPSERLAVTLRYLATGETFVLAEP